MTLNLGHNRSSGSKFVSNAKLSELWTEYARSDKAAPSMMPFSGKNREALLKDLFESPNVPAVFKLRVLEWHP